jgi:hypothetical protein
MDDIVEIVPDHQADAESETGGTRSHVNNYFLYTEAFIDDKWVCINTALMWTGSDTLR